MAKFSTLMVDLSALTGAPVPDGDQGACDVTLEDGTMVGVEDSSSHPGNVSLFAELADLPVGRFRQDALEAALKFNGRPFPRGGDIGFMQHDGKLCLFQFIPADDLSAIQLWDEIRAFGANVKLWKDALQNNSLPNFGPSEPSGPSGMFGL